MAGLSSLIRSLLRCVTVDGEGFPLFGELWCLRHSCVGDAMVYHCTSTVLLYASPFCVSIGSNDGVLPVRFQAIIRVNDGRPLIGFLIGFWCAKQDTAIFMLLKCRLHMVDSMPRPQWVIVMNSDIRHTYVITETPHANDAPGDQYVNALLRLKKRWTTWNDPLQVN